MNYGNIKNFDVANGAGVRVSLFVSGCTNRCEDCFQPETWSFSYGEPFDEAVQEKILAMLEPEYISGLSVLGGEPFEFSNQEALVPFLKKVRKQYPDKDIWAWTGFRYEDLLPEGKRHGEHTDELLSLVDVLVDGPFEPDKKDVSLFFRGSWNQRIIDLKKTGETGKIVIRRS